MARHDLSPLALTASLYRNRQLIRELVKRDVSGRYRGSVLGIFWSFLQPIIMLMIYTLVFSQVFKARWLGDAGQSEMYFAINLFAGLIIFNIFSECITRSPGAILSQSNFVTRIIFPLEIIPVVHLLSASFHALVSIIVLLGATLATLGHLPITLLLLPSVLIPLILFTLGLGWGLAATGVYLRDIGQTINLMVTGLLFLSPVFFPIEALPERWRILAAFNPVALPIEQTRKLLILGQLPDWASLGAYTVLAGLAAWLGFAIFQKLRNGFSDVL